MMFQHMTMEKPLSWVVGNKDKVHSFTWLHEVGVSQETFGFRPKFLGINPEMLAMKVH